MNSVFIVDDESLVIKSLIASIDWNSFGYEVIGEAGNGIDAYEKIRAYRPDIVFTDIRMPGLSGLELIKKINDILPNIQFVVMSGYAEFVYVQKALSYGALGYCLKPFDEVEIESILKRASKIILRNKKSLEMELLTVIDDVSEYGCNRRKELIRLMGFNWDESEGVYVVVSQKISNIKWDIGFGIISFKIGKNRYAHLVASNLIDDVMNKLTDVNYENTGSIGVSRIISTPDFISDAIEEACIALYHFFITGKKFVYKYFEPEISKISDKLMKLRNYVSTGDITETVKLLDSFEEAFIKGSYNVIQAFQIYSIIMYSNAVSGNITFDSLIYNYEQLITMFTNAGEMLSYLKTVIRQTDSTAQSMFSDIKNDTLRNILEYVNDYYGEDISIQGISRKFNVNPCYLSQLFKKETGMTFTDYITELRIKCACSLLKTTAMSINEVSEKVGFNDYYYFTRVFKKVVGNTPSQYREK